MSENIKEVWECLFQNNLAFEISRPIIAIVPMEFLKSLYDISFYVPGTYAETWKIIMENGNSLKRYLTCFYFEKIGIMIEE